MIKEEIRMARERKLAKRNGSLGMGVSKPGTSQGPPRMSVPG